MNIVELGLETYLNQLTEPVSKKQLYEDLSLHAWSTDFKLSHLTTKEIREEFGILYAEYGDHEDEFYEPIDFSNNKDKLIRRMSYQHSVYRVINKLIREGRVKDGVVIDPFITRSFSGFEAKVKESIFFFKAFNYPPEDYECSWKISRWWNLYGNLPWVIERENCECAECNKWKVDNIKIDEDNIRKDFFNKLVLSFYKEVKIVSGNRCIECDEQFNSNKNSGKNCYKCIPKFNYLDDLSDINSGCFIAMCGSCMSKHSVQDKYGLPYKRKNTVKENYGLKEEVRPRRDR